MCLRICTGFKEVCFRETHLREHFGRTDKVALITCLKKLNVSGAFLTFTSTLGLIAFLKSKNRQCKRKCNFGLTGESSWFLKLDPHIQGKKRYEQNFGHENCRVCLVLKRFGPYIFCLARCFYIHRFCPVYVGGGVTRLFLTNEI